MCIGPSGLDISETSINNFPFKLLEPSVAAGLQTASVRTCLRVSANRSRLLLSVDAGLEVVYSM